MSIQKSRMIALGTSFGEDVLFVHRAEITEKLSQCFEIRLDLFSARNDLSAKEAISTTATIRLETEAGESRFFSGSIAEFASVGSDGRHFHYRAVLRPTLWWLSRNQDCRIFISKSVPDVLKEVLNQAGVDRVDYRLSASYPTRDMIIQYRESDLDFVQRLAEQEGIYYKFEHTNGEHEVVFSDKVAAYDMVEGESDLPFLVDSAKAVPGKTYVTEWQVNFCEEISSVSVSDHCYLQAEVVQAAAASDSSMGAGEQYEYPGGFATANDAARLAEVRLEERRCAASLHFGKTQARRVACGRAFVLTDHYQNDQNKKYYVIEAKTSFESSEHLSGSANAENMYKCSFTAIPFSRQYRPQRLTPRPRIFGPQTALVVGPEKEPSKEVHTDEHGRVKIQFHWDRMGDGKGENSSCWVRVSQAWAGNQWGMQFIPRIGQEVLIEFLEGNPDRPLVTGSVFNGSNKPAFALPKNQSVSGVLSRTLDSGEGGNEFRFDDSEGEEEIFLGAQMDLEIRVGNDRHETVLNDRHLVVENDAFEHVKNDRNLSVDRDWKRKIGRDLTLSVDGKQAASIGGSSTLKVTGDVGEEYLKNHSIAVTKDQFVSASNIVLEASENITLKVGGSSIAISSDGIKISTSGEVVIDAGGGVEVTAQGEVAITAGTSAALSGGTDVEVSAPNVDISGDALVKVKGGVIKLN